MRILIPNATGPTNTGDQAMLQVLLALIDGSQKNKEIKIHTKNPELYETSYSHETAPSIYQYIAIDSQNPFVRMYRLTIMIVYLLLMKQEWLGILNIKKNDALSHLLNDYKDSDLTLFAGGGYIRSRCGVKQAINLFFQLLPFAIAKLYKNYTIVAPISFGPFAYRWQAKLSAKILNGCDVVSAREAQSYKEMKSLGVKNLFLSNDLALLLSKSKQLTSNTNIKNRVVVGFTIRNWLKESGKQKKLEKAYAEALTELSHKLGVKIQPIIQVKSKEFPFEDDARSVYRVCVLLKEANVSYRTPTRIRSVDHATQVYRRLDLLLGMRMHSNILAATQGVPFVAISYEYKTEGIAEQIAMKKYCLACEKADKESVYGLLLDVYKNRKKIKNRLIQSIASIRSTEEKRWRNLLSKY